MMKNQNCLDKEMQIEQEMLTLTDQHLVMFLATIQLVAQARSSPQLPSPLLKLKIATLSLVWKLYGYAD